MSGRRVQAEVAMKRLVVLLMFLQAATIGAEEPQLGSPT